VTSTTASSAASTTASSATASTTTAGPEAPAPEAPARKGSSRLLALDAARGLAIVVMLVVMNPGPTAYMPAQLHHPDWAGLTFADLFFPLFLVCIGVSMTLSARGLDARHVLYRAGVLLVLGIALNSLKHETFAKTGVLQHIAVSYVVAFLILRLPRRWQPPVAAAVVLAFWAAFVIWAPESDPWSQSGTLAHTVDERLFGGFTTEGTLQSLISSVTVLAGAWVGRLVKAQPDRRQLMRTMAVWAAGLVAFGAAFAVVVPLNKHLWTPSFTVLTIGTSLAWIALGIWLIDLRGARRTTAPLVHLGANPIAIYVGFFATLSLLRNYGDPILPTIEPGGSPELGAYLYAAVWTVVWWLVAYALYRRKIFLKL
jgi:predicted acyltransferase